MVGQKVRSYTRTGNNTCTEQAATITAYAGNPLMPYRLTCDLIRLKGRLEGPLGLNGEESSLKDILIVILF